tara:strand:+ start:149 stop:652 length:504 start_codon:yes stop_codon:yes gene_type:complete
MTKKNKQIIYIILISFFLGILRFLFVPESNFTFFKVPDKIFSADVKKLVDIISKPDTTFSDPIIIDSESAYNIYTLGIQFIDARDAADFLKNHIQDAINIPWYDVESYEWIINDLDPAKAYVIYCSGGECSLSMDLAYYMMEDLDFDKVLIYEDGMPDWIEKGHPVE